MLLSFLILTASDAACARVSIDPFSETVYLAQEPAQPVSSRLTIRQRNDDSGFVLTAVGPCHGSVSVVQKPGKTEVLCKPGASSTYTRFIHDNITTAKKLKPSQQDLKAADLLVAAGKFKEARMAYLRLMKRGLDKISRLAEISAAAQCVRAGEQCPSLDAWEIETSEERERLVLLRLTQQRPAEALALAKPLQSLSAYVLREHALALMVRNAYLQGDDLALVALYFHHEAAVDAHGDAPELRALVLHSLYELEADAEMRAMRRDEDMRSPAIAHMFGTLPAQEKIQQPEAKEGQPHE